MCTISSEWACAVIHMLHTQAGKQLAVSAAFTTCKFWQEQMLLPCVALHVVRQGPPVLEKATHPGMNCARPYCAVQNS